MSLFSVPQFIEKESAIVGPLTLRQFFTIVATGAVCFIVYKILPAILSFPLIIVFIGLSISIAFVQIGGIPFYKLFLAGVNFIIFSPKRFFWGKGPKGKMTMETVEFKKEKEIEIRFKKESRLKAINILVESKK